MIEAERVPDRDDEVAGQDRVRVTERQRRKILRIRDLDQRQVGLRVLTDDLRVAHLAVGEVDLDLVDAVDHVVVGDDVAVGRDHEATAQARNLELLLARRLARAAAARPAEELLERIGR